MANLTPNQQDLNQAYETITSLIEYFDRESTRFNRIDFVCIQSALEDVETLLEKSNSLTLDKYDLLTQPLEQAKIVLEFLIEPRTTNSYKKSFNFVIKPSAVYSALCKIKELLENAQKAMKGGKQWLN